MSGNPLKLVRCSRLDLAGNDLSKPKVRAKLVTALGSGQCRVRVLRLKSCSLKVEGCKAVAGVLKSNKTIVSIDLGVIIMTSDLREANFSQTC